MMKPKDVRPVLAVIAFCIPRILSKTTRQATWRTIRAAWFGYEDYPYWSPSDAEFVD